MARNKLLNGAGGYARASNGQRSDNPTGSDRSKSCSYKPFHTANRRCYCVRVPRSASTRGRRQ